MTKQEMVDMYCGFLKEQGFAPEIDPDGDVVFMYEGCSYVITPCEGDDEFFRLIHPNILHIDDDLERIQSVEAALTATARTKVAKVFMVGDDIWASAEMFCSPPQVMKEVFRRCLFAIQAAVHSFRMEMAEKSITFDREMRSGK